MPAPHESEQDDDVQDQSDAADVHQRLLQLRDDLAKTRVQGVAAFDQFVAYLRDLGHSVDAVSSFELPPGQRLELVNALTGLIRRAIFGMELDAEPPTDRRDVYTETIDELEEVICYAQEKRLEARARTVAAELASDGDWEIYDEIFGNPALFRHLEDEAGLTPSDATIREWLMRNVPRHRRRR